MTEEELAARSVTSLEIEERAKVINNSAFKGKAKVSFIDLLGFSSEIINEWGTTDDPLLRLMKIKSFHTLAAQRAETHKFFDQPFIDEESFQNNNVKLIAESKYPQVFSFSDSFIINL